MRLLTLMFALSSGSAVTSGILWVSAWLSGRF
jgi:hypothetical protein